MHAQAVRWRKYGNDRLYVTAGDGTKLGHHDLLTGLDHLAEVGQAEAFHSALAAWRDTAAGQGPPAETEVAPAPFKAASPLLEVPVDVAPAPPVEGVGQVPVLQPEPAAQWDATRRCPSLTTKHITPHTLRHTAAMDLLQAGVDTSVIALWLGHASTRSTQPYLHADLTIKEQALARTAPHPAARHRYQPSDPLLAFLESL